MIFETMTSEYEIANDNGEYTLTKKSVKDGCHSRVEAGRLFHAKRDEISLFKFEGCVKLDFGKLSTSHIPEHEELEAWLEAK